MLTIHGVKYHVGVSLIEKRKDRGCLLQLHPTSRGQDPSQLPLDGFQHFAGPFQQGMVFLKGGATIPRPGKQVQKWFDGISEYFCRQNIPFLAQPADQVPNVIPGQCLPEHLPGSVRQLVCLVYHQSAVFRQNGLLPGAPVDGIGQQQVMIADLEGKIIGGTHLHKIPIPASIPVATADLGNANTLPVIAAEMGSLVNIQMVLQGYECLGCLGILLCKVGPAQPVLQTKVADIVGLAFSDDGPDGFLQFAVCHQHRGQQGQILVQHRPLQGDAGSGDNDGLLCQLAGGTIAVNRDPGHQIGKGLSDAGPGITQGDAAVQHCLQHPVAQQQLFRAFLHALGRQQFFENVVDILMGIFPVIHIIHVVKSPIIKDYKKVIFRSYRIRPRPPIRLGTIRSYFRQEVPRAIYLGPLLLSTPGQRRLSYAQAKQGVSL